MLSISSLFSSIERAYRRTEELFRSLSESVVDVEATVAECMEEFDGLFLSRSTEISLKAYFRYLISDEVTLREIPFNFIVTEDAYADALCEAFYRALRVITGSELEVRTVDERRLLSAPEEELRLWGDCSVYVIQNCGESPMTPEEVVAWQQAAELFELTPCIVKLLRAPREVIDTRFREVDHIYYRVFRNRLCCQDPSSEEVEAALLRALEKKGFSWTPDFAEGLSAYIARVYPTADLKSGAFVTDMIERIVFFYSAEPRPSLLLDRACVPHYETQSSKDASTEAPVPAEKPALPAEPTVDEYAAAEPRPPVRSILIVSLSTFPKSRDVSQPSRIGACTFYYAGAEAADAERSTYYYQQEPFPMHLRAVLKDAGEILMLTTPETRKPVLVEVGGDPPAVISPQAFFMDAVRRLPGLEDVRFKSVAVNQETPASAVSEVVAHLREIKRNNGGSAAEVYLGTNGGLRGIQLILEAILSLLNADGIDVKPDHVWSTRQETGNRFVLFNSAAEFQIFDFVSGINEFLNYGRIGSLQRFIEHDPELKADDSAAGLLQCLKAVSEGIQFCSVKSFKNGLEQLIAYYQTAPDPSSPFIQMFFENIKNDFGDLLNEDHDTLDEIEWCVRKGFLQQAFTLVENSMPMEYVKKDLITCSRDVEDEINSIMRRERSMEKVVPLYLYNEIVNYQFVEKKMIDLSKPFENGQFSGSEWKRLKQSLPFPCFFHKTDYPRNHRNNPNPGGNINAEITICLDTSKEGEVFSKRFCGILRTHYWVKRFRNGLMHNSERKGTEVCHYEAAIYDFIENTRKLYVEMRQAVYRAPLLTLSLADTHAAEPPAPSPAEPPVPASDEVLERLKEWKGLPVRSPKKAAKEGGKSS